MKENIKKTFSKRLSQKMKEHNVSQAELARVLGITRVSVNQYLTGKCLPKIEYLEKICSMFQVSSMWLYGFEENLDDYPLEVSYEEYEKGRKKLAIKEFLEQVANVKVEVQDYTKKVLENGMLEVALELAAETKDSVCCTFNINGLTFDVTNEEYDEFVFEIINHCQELLKEMVMKKISK